MTKKEISYTDLVKVTMDKARAEAKKLGKDFDRDFMMEEFPGARTFPQIRVDGENVGGYTEFKALIDARL